MSCGAVMCYTTLHSPHPLLQTDNLIPLSTLCLTSLPLLFLFLFLPLQAKGVVFNIVGGNDLTLQEVRGSKVPNTLSHGNALPSRLCLNCLLLFNS